MSDPTYNTISAWLAENISPICSCCNQKDNETGLSPLVLVRDDVDEKKPLITYDRKVNQTWIGDIPSIEMYSVLCVNCGHTLKFSKGFLDYKVSSNV